MGNNCAYVETSYPNKGSNKRTVAICTKLCNITRVSLCYHGRGVQICRSRPQNSGESGNWCDQILFLMEGDLTPRWVLLETRLDEPHKGIGFFSIKIVQHKVI